MKRLFLALLLLTSAALARPTHLLEGRLTLDLPEGFVQLSAEEIGRKFPPLRPPKVAFANNRKNMTVTVAVTISEATVKPGELRAFGEYLKKVLSATGEVVAHGQIEIGGRSWYRILLQTEAVDQPVRNEILVTPMGSQVMMLNLNSTLADYPQYEKALQRTIESLVLSSETSK